MVTTDLEQRVEVLEANQANLATRDDLRETKDDLESAISDVRDVLQRIENRLEALDRRADNVEDHSAMLARFASLIHDEVKSVNGRLGNVEGIVLDTNNELKRRTISFTVEGTD